MNTASPFRYLLAVIDQLIKRGEVVTGQSALVASIQFQKMCAVPVVPGFGLLRTGVANDGSLLFLFAEQAASSFLAETHKQGGAVFPRTRAGVPVRLCLVRMTSDTSKVIELPELDLTFPLVDVFPDGQILVVGPRCEWRGENDFDLNGAVIRPDGGQTTRILLGDGISSTQIDCLGRIWVSYFDEGVFGNFGWGGPSGPAPVGSTGLACFSASGAKIWSFPEDAIHAISDCYALNVSGDAAAAFVYTDFPVCRINHDFELTFWTTTLAGCHAFAMSEAEVLFSGQYKDAPDVAYLGKIGTGDIANTKRMRLLMPDGSSRPNGQLLGRGKYLYHFDDENAYRLGLD